MSDRGANFAGFELTVDEHGVATVVSSTGEEFSFQPDGPQDAALVVENFMKRPGMLGALAALLVEGVNW